MLITVEQLAQFSGTFKDNDATTTSLLNIYIGAATEVIISYLGYNPETAERFKNDDGDIVIPDLIKFVCLEIADLMQLEEKNNIGVNSKSFGESGSRSFLNVVDYSRYLNRLSIYRAVTNG